MLETTTHVNCIGQFSNQTMVENDKVTIVTKCSGQFQQVQVMDLLKKEMMSDGAEVFMIYTKIETFYNLYSCTDEFVYQNELGWESYVDLSQKEGNAKLTCSSAQTIQIMKAYCGCGDGRMNFVSCLNHD